MSFSLDLPEDYYSTGIANANQAAADASATASVSATGSSAGDIAIWNGSEYVAGSVISGSGISMAIVYYPTYGLQFGITASTLRTALGIGGPWNLAGTVAPTVNEDSGDGYAIGSVWIDTVLDEVYMATDVTVGAAVWKKLSP